MFANALFCMGAKAEYELACKHMICSRAHGLQTRICSQADRRGSQGLQKYDMPASTMLGNIFIPPTDGPILLLAAALGYMHLCCPDLTCLCCLRCHDHPSLATAIPPLAAAPFHPQYQPLLTNISYVCSAWNISYVCKLARALTNISYVL
jgi:hypothetical protein